VIAVDPADFPTDRYVVAGIARTAGLTLRSGFDDLADVAVAVRSLVDYRTAELLDLRAETARVADAGAVVVWDLSHAAGAVEVDLTAAGVELATGCTYKFLHGGPGAPAWAYVAPELQPTLAQPIWGWFAQREQFEMGEQYAPYPDVRRLLLGTPGILGLAAAEVGIGLVADAGVTAIAAKGRALTGFALELCRQLGLESPTPIDPERRGAHVAVRVTDADRVHRELTERGVLTDARRPDVIRLGCAPLTTRFTDVFDGLTGLAGVEQRDRHRTSSSRDTPDG
jgi:kynureninase